MSPFSAPLHSVVLLGVRSRFGVSFLTLLLAYTSVFPRSIQAIEPPEKIRLLTIHGATYFTPLLAWSPAGWEIEQPDPQEIPTQQVLAVDWSSRPILPLYRQPQLVLVNGDRISLVIDAWDEEALSGQGLTSSGKPLRIPLEYLRGAILQPLSTLRGLAENLERIQSHQPGSDLAILANGDQIRGQIIRLESGNFQFERESAKVSLARPQIVSIALNPQLSTSIESAAETSQLCVTLIDGSRLTLTAWQKTTNNITGNLIGGIPVEIGLSSLASLRFHSDRIISLTDLKPAAVRFTPFLNSRLNLKTDANVSGGPLLVNGHPLPLGLGFYSRMEATYDLNGGFSGFLTSWGMDDLARNRGSAHCQILIDGKVLYDLPQLKGGDPLVQTPLLNVAQARQLTLLVDFGEEGDLLDFVDCCDPLLIKSP